MWKCDPMRQTLKSSEMDITLKKSLSDVTEGIYYQTKGNSARDTDNTDIWWNLERINRNLPRILNNLNCAIDFLLAKKHTKKYKDAITIQWFWSSREVL